MNLIIVKGEDNIEKRGGGGAVHRLRVRKMTLISVREEDQFNKCKKKMLRIKF